jgi:hypothetical protein
MDRINTFARARAGNRRSATTALAGFLTASALGTAAALSVAPTAIADQQHTITYTITGHGDAYSIIPDPGTPVYPASSTTWVPLPWTSTVPTSGHPYVALNWTDKTGTHDCVISVDGHVVPLTEHAPGRCAYQIP